MWPQGFRVSAVSANLLEAQEDVCLVLGHWLPVGAEGHCLVELHLAEQAEHMSWPRMVF